MIRMIYDTRCENITRYVKYVDMRSIGLYISSHERAFNILYNVLCNNTCLSGALLTCVNVSSL